MAKYAHMGIWAYVKKIWSRGVSPKKASKMQLRDVDLRSVGPSVEKVWKKNFFFAKKMPCILHYNAKKISNTISSQVWAGLNCQMFSNLLWTKNPTTRSLGDSLVHFANTLAKIGTNASHAVHLNTSRPKKQI